MLELRPQPCLVDLLDSMLPYTFLFALGPSFYLYIYTTIQTEKVSLKTIFKAYLPAFIDLIFRFCLIIYTILSNNGIIKAIDPHKIDVIYHPPAQVLMVAVFWIYLIAAIKLPGRQHKDNYHAAAEQNLAARWIKTLLIAMTGVAIVWTVTILGSVLLNIHELSNIAPIEIILIILVYWIGFKGYQNTRFVYINAQNALKNYTDKITAQEAGACISLLIRAMDADKLYLDPTLSVNKLAHKLQLNAKLVSAVLNGPLNKGFNTFVNEYRVRDVKEKLLQDQNSHLTIFGVALNCGFSSQATFQRVFKELTGVSPSEYRKNTAQNRI